VSTPTPLEGLLPLPRTLVQLRGASPGPLLLVVAGIHGNEPAGVLAALACLGRLQGSQRSIRGDVVALAGNLGALAARRRFLDRDLNRGWTAGLAARPATGREAEDAEQAELVTALDDALAGARGPVYFLDLHTTSADGIPFGLIEDEPDARELARHFQLPVVLGLLGSVRSTLLTYMSGRGAVALGVEGGGNESPSSVECHQAVLAVALQAAGLVAPGDLPGLADARARLAAARASPGTGSAWSPASRTSTGWRRAGSWQATARARSGRPRTATSSCPATRRPGRTASSSLSRSAEW